MNNKNVLVTGAHGFIGRHVARYYGERGWHVVGMGHGGWTREEWEAWNLSEWYTSDVNFDSLTANAGRPDCLIHCAGSGSVGFSITYPFADYRKTVETTAHVLEFVRIHAPKAKVIVLSSAGVYGVADRLPITEESALIPVSPYGVHKKLSEDLCRSYGQYFGISSAVVRLFSVYGNGLLKQLLWDACTKIKKNENTFYGTGNETRDLLHVNDAVELIMVAGEHASSDCPAVNGGSGSGITVREIVNQIYSYYGRHESPVFNGIIRHGDPLHYVANITKALSWGWKPTINWKTGIEEYVRWFKEGAK